jgi:ACT domain-containing protein
VALLVLYQLCVDQLLLVVHTVHVQTFALDGRATVKVSLSTSLLEVIVPALFTRVLFSLENPWAVATLDLD